MGVLDPNNELKPLFKQNHVEFSDLGETALGDFQGKLAIIGPFQTKVQMREGLAQTIQKIARKGAAVVWLQPPPGLKDPIKPSFYIVPGGKGTVVVVQADLVASLADSPQVPAQLDLFLQTGVKPHAVSPARFENSTMKPKLIMKTRIALILALLLAAGTTVRAATNDVLTVAVFDFESKDESVRGLGPKVATLVNANLSAEPQIITVERADLEKVLGEQELGLSGTVDPNSAAKVGQLTGAKVLVTGRVFRADNELILVAKIIGTETSRVYGELAKGNANASITDLSADLAKKIAADVDPERRHARGQNRNP